jgi:hypothetical protein
MRISLVKRIKLLSESKIKYQASRYDKKKEFPKFITKFLKKKDLQYLLSYHSGYRSINAKLESDFYYNATKYCANIRNYFLVSIGMVGAGIYKYGTVKQKREYEDNIVNKNEIYALAITEKSAGSDINSIKTSYKFLNNKFTLNGEKTWITLGGVAKHFVILAKGDFGLLLFCAKKNQSIKISTLKNIISNKGSSIGKIKIKNLILNHSDILGDKKKISSTNALEYILINGRAIASISAASMSEAALEEAIIYSKNRIQFGKRIFQFQQIQDIFTNASVDIETLKLLAEKSFFIKRKNYQEGKFICNSAKFFSSKVINNTTNELMKIFGANSNTENFNIERYNREAKAYMFIEGTSQILSQIISSHLMTKY